MRFSGPVLYFAGNEILRTVNNGVEKSRNYFPWYREFSVSYFGVLEFSYFSYFFSFTLIINAIKKNSYIFN